MPDRGRTEKNKIFSYSEAVALLPEIQRLTLEAYRRVEAATAEPAEGGLPERAEREIETIVSDWAQAVIGYGAVVKALWLVDFDNGSGYYCWRHPEPGLHYFHSYEDGFAGRVPIQ
jgi:hypothetical protein